MKVTNLELKPEEMLRMEETALRSVVAHIAGLPDTSDYSPELSRSFRGLRVWLPLKLFGVQAFRENLSESCS